MDGLTDGQRYVGTYEKGERKGGMEGQPREGWWHDTSKRGRDVGMDRQTRGRGMVA